MIKVRAYVQEAHRLTIEQNRKPKTVIRDSLRKHVMMCVDNAQTITEALELTAELENEIVGRVRQYAKCLGHVTAYYKEWLISDYKTKLNIMVTKMMQRKETRLMAS